ncbi:type IV secretion system DNA-binding domain-containing protein [Mycobacterium intracellulare]|uniref:type IV secretion system DNA-binding domain-containing protein n=1 Tax=Mycobacterium intracellulare TaxID=1767 RepID=UPI001EEE3842|nr:type IV secretion system DNA-binding domain-containing protein [Mycobacterium intracellulare]MEE3755255.1 type IV secretion system DNA-binding domain-containing protein [Mycobacterium intracellulare]
MTVVLGLVGAWLMSCYFNGFSSFWCRIGMLSPAGQPRLFGLPWCYPAVGWTTGTLLVDAAVLAAVCVLAHALSKYHSQKVTGEDGKKRTERSFASARAAHFYVNILGCSAVAAGLGIGLQFGWGPTFAVPLSLLGLVVLTVESGRHRTPAAVGDGENDVDDSQFVGLAEPLDLSALPPHFLQRGSLHEDLRRLVKLAASKFPYKLALDIGATELENDGKGAYRLVAWGFRCAEPGYLTDTGVQQKLQTTFLKGAGGIWSFRFDPRSDIFGASRKSGIPTLAWPPMWPVISSVPEARKHYTGWEFKVGVSARGVIGVCMEKMAHVKVIGETGAGKSVAIRSWLEQFRAMGWMLILADGKGADYAGYFAPHEDDHGLPVPGTVAVGLGSTARGMAYVGAIVLAYQILLERQDGSLQGKIDDPENWNSFTPVLLVLDEIKSMREKWKSLGKEWASVIESMVTEITSLGRELRVHVMIISQDARDVSIPGVWNSNLPLTISLGKPSPMTVDKGFEDSVRPKVRMIRESMDPGIKGRCLIASIDPDTGAADATEYQGYLGYSPGEHWNNPKLPPNTKDNWIPFKEQVSDRVPRLYTRQWFMINEKSAAQREAEENGEPDRGFIDFDLFTVDEIKRLDRVRLDMRDPKTGKIVPNSEMAKYDPSSRQYVCRPKGSRRKIVAEL